MQCFVVERTQPNMYCQRGGCFIHSSELVENGFVVFISQIWRKEEEEEQQQQEQQEQPKRFTAVS